MRWEETTLMRWGEPERPVEPTDVLKALASAFVASLLVTAVGLLLIA